MKHSINLLILFFSFEVFAQVDSIPFPSGYIPSQLRYKSIVRVSPNDHVWVGFRDIGVGEYDGTTWKMYTDTNGLPSKFVSALAFDGNVKWIGTDNGLVKMDGTNLVLFYTGNSPLPSNKINYLHVSDTTLWIATNSGVVSFNGTNYVVYNKANSPLGSDTILSVSENAFGLYIADKRKVSVLTNNGWKSTTPDVSPVYRFTLDKNENLYYLNFQIRDTVFQEVIIPSDPCLYDNLNVQPYVYFGATTNNKIFATTDLSDGPLVLEFDSSMNVQNSYYDYHILPAPILADSLKLFDFSSTGEFIITRSGAGINNIYKINFNGLNSIVKPDTCPYLDINQVQAHIRNNGSMFWDLKGNPLYEVPKNGGKSSVFCEGIWIGGKDSQNKLHLAAQTYRQSGNDFWPGPLDTTNATTDSITTQQYDKLWKIDKYTVLNFIFNFQNGNVTNGTYPVPNIILNWPVHGFGNYSRSLAPFVDFNNDGIYNPYNGDYPDIKGDQFFWWVFNDNFSSHEETGSQYNLGVEVHGSAYAYNCPQLINGDTVINYTTFYHYDFINRSDTDYQDVYIGIFTDIDLGNYLDDYVGCDTTLDIAFGLNGDNDDDGNMGYGLNPPMINLALLKGPEPQPNDGLDNNHNGIIDESGEICMMNYFVYYNNDNTNIGNPNVAYHFNNYLQGLWKDSMPMTFWGTGYNPGSVDTAHYMFSGAPYDTTAGWSENHPCIGCLPNEPSDRRFVVSSGPFQLPAGSKRSIDYAYIYTHEPNQPNGPLTSFAVNQDQVMRIKNFFETDSFPCNQLIGIDEIGKKFLSVNLYPNPAHSEIYVSLLQGDPGIKSYFISNVLGEEITGRIKFTSSTFRIDLTKLTPGIYFLQVQSGEKSGVRKFIVE
jgi:hypothetical protein